MPHWVPKILGLFESVRLMDFKWDCREALGYMDYTFHECM